MAYVKVKGSSINVPDGLIVAVDDAGNLLSVTVDKNNKEPRSIQVAPFVQDLLNADVDPLDIIAALNSVPKPAATVWQKIAVEQIEKVIKMLLEKVPSALDIIDAFSKENEKGNSIWGSLSWLMICSLQNSCFQGRECVAAIIQALNTPSSVSKLTPWASWLQSCNLIPDMISSFLKGPNIDRSDIIDAFNIPNANGEIVWHLLTDSYPLHNSTDKHTHPELLLGIMRIVIYSFKDAELVLKAFNIPNNAGHTVWAYHSQAGILALMTSLLDSKSAVSLEIIGALNETNAKGCTAWQAFESNTCAELVEFLATDIETAQNILAGFNMSNGVVWQTLEFSDIHHMVPHLAKDKNTAYIIMDSLKTMRRDLFDGDTREAMRALWSKLSVTAEVEDIYPGQMSTRESFFAPKNTVVMDSNIPRAATITRDALNEILSLYLQSRTRGLKMFLCMNGNSTITNLKRLVNNSNRTCFNWDEIRECIAPDRLDVEKPSGYTDKIVEQIKNKLLESPVNQSICSM